MSAMTKTDNCINMNTVKNLNIYKVIIIIYDKIISFSNTPLLFQHSVSFKPPPCEEVSLSVRLGSRTPIFEFKNCCCLATLASFLGFQIGEPIGGVRAAALENFSGFALANVSLADEPEWLDTLRLEHDEFSLLAPVVSPPQWGILGWWEGLKFSSDSST